MILNNHDFTPPDRPLFTYKFKNGTVNTGTWEDFIRDRNADNIGDAISSPSAMTLDEVFPGLRENLGTILDINVT